jgi:predicted dehydrogenase
MLLLGKHVLVEKPLTLDIMEADELFMHAQYAYQCGGLVLQSGLVELFSPAFLEAKAALREAPTFIQTYRVGGYNERYGDVSVVMDLLIHDLGNVLNLTGYTLPVAVEVIGSSSVSKKTDEVDVALLFSSGLQVGMHADRISAAPIRYTDIIGTDQQLHIDYLHGKTRDTLTPQLENFVDAIESGAASRTDEELAVLKLALYIDALAAESCAPAEEATA